ncbi:PfkB family carbohydrate kinase [Paludibacterium yongneupense]|uniref:PfkB family carbohydrate kinase n=1 Tax=Paludibacterium yongneupense TaxID=400061 RepID=UPI0004278BD0|nr:PfkB family carbohydrate kinase [Paludibacterium yongneupense]
MLPGRPFGSREHAPAVAEWFHRAGVVRIVLSLGAYGVYYSSDGEAGWMDALPVDVVSVNGAGDALMAGLAYGFLHAIPFVDTVRFALACAAMTLTCHDNCHPHLSAAAVGALLQRTAAGTMADGRAVALPPAA